MPETETPITEEELAAFTRTLGRLRQLPLGDRTRRRADRMIASFARDSRRERRQGQRDMRAAADAAVLAATATCAADRREDAPLASAAGTPGELIRARRCYVCKANYQQVDGFYHMLCPACAALNGAHRALATDLRGRRVLLTGGRVKIGFQLALMMLRDGAELIVTSRFPADTVRRFQAAPGSEQWLDRLTVLALDLRDPRQVLALCEHLHAQGRPLDILVNNAAQTVRRPAAAYAALTAGESVPLTGPAAHQVTRWAAPGFSLRTALGPGTGSGRPALPVDEAGLLPDTAPANSWSARLGELDPAELLEVQLVNAVAPALLCDRLLPLLLASPHPRRYVVNVTAVEGRFAVRNKTAGHPHTNMAKAALNMLTRTSAAELAARGVHMCAVDTGWITDENPAPKKARISARGFRTPLDIVDGAARVYHPIVLGEAGEPVSGVFLKDYQEADW
ncbi:short-chain dehydrogenase [Streptomyces tateyamensis]|uniref:Short-chain dehydrogenase n=1 Tax=Streptomyces tateyamensis TaxID=565073 RepID=A0A2V4P0Y9_9ACTN|nr:SDR family oxidoreductase [Streptomyces tateyamensis]PYC88297.1 short-chain dehydrogenase [Streptomyces tateyamensis]